MLPFIHYNLHVTIPHITCHHIIRKPLTIHKSISLLRYNLSPCITDHNLSLYNNLSSYFTTHNAWKPTSQTTTCHHKWQPLVTIHIANHHTLSPCTMTQSRSLHIKTHFTTFYHRHYTPHKSPYTQPKGYHHIQTQPHHNTTQRTISPCITSPQTYNHTTHHHRHHSL